MPYEKVARVNPRSVEIHTTGSAHPFRAALDPGRYRLTVERGKEYVASSRELMIGAEPVSVRVLLHRWIDLASRGWFSGDTHLHRELGEVPTVMQAEDLNVTFPLTYWVTRALTSPGSGDKNTSGKIPEELIEIDATHVSRCATTRRNWLATRALERMTPICVPGWRTWCGITVLRPPKFALPPDWAQRKLPPRCNDSTLCRIPDRSERRES